ncbi:MAG: RtcB family protein [bacterium]
MSNKKSGHIEQVNENLWRLDQGYLQGMRVPGLIYVSENLMAMAQKDNALNQVANVATLPGIVEASLAMPDIHWGYGFAIGGVAAFDPERGGIVSPGGVGYDINCGVRLILSNLDASEVADKIEPLVNRIFSNVPRGVGKGGDILLEGKKMEKILRDGARAVLKQGMCWESDLDKIEENGALEGAEPDLVSKRALERGKKQCGSLGSGNHFLELQIVDEIFDREAANASGLAEGMLTVMVHTGSRGLGHQICDDTLRIMRDAVNKYGIELPDRQLACAPLTSKEGRQYLAEMACAANFAWANRSILTHLIRDAFEKILGESAERLGIDVVYDVAHNIAKWETHTVDGKRKKLLVHRKGATRAFPSGHPDVPAQYRHIGQPVIIPGDMGSASWVLRARQKAMEDTFGSTCHGAGRAMGRGEAKRTIDYNDLMKTMDSKGILVRTASRKDLVEEAPEAYKDVDEVVEVTHRSGISTKVARLRPLAVVKG